MNQLASFFLSFVALFNFLPFMGTHKTIHDSKQIMIAKTPITPTSVPTIPDTPTPTPLPVIPCIIGDNEFSITQSSCDNVRNAIQNLRNQDTVAIQGKINDLKSEEQPYLDKFSSINFESCSKDFCTDCAPSLNTQMMQTCENGLLMQANLDRNMINYYGSQIKWLTGYEATVKVGSAGNGACSDHNGVNCLSGKGSYGQVFCNDGWSQSSVYYFNVDECVKYYVNNIVGK